MSSMPVKYGRNASNLGMARNILKAAGMADGEFVWLLGDDDLLMPDAIEGVCALIDGHRGVDYFFVNANLLTSDYVLSFSRPFVLSDLPKRMRPFSPRRENGEMSFMDLIDPAISFDFLGGIYLSVFRRSQWMTSAHVVDEGALSDMRTFSHFDNTFPHVKILAHAFAKSKAYFCARPMSVTLAGAREWSLLYPLVRSVRLVEALGEYRRNGLSIYKYYSCRNAALKTFAEDMTRMAVHRGKSGLAGVNPLKIIASNLAYPNFYLSFVYPFLRSSAWAKLGSRVCKR
jgi:hypothetical protein